MASHGRYTIKGKLADGGMAEIFLAVQHGMEGFEKPVVLKRILTQYSADQQFRNMLLDEAHISMSLQHSNIAQVLDLGVAGGRYFLALELVDGWDLERILQRARAAGMVWPAALGLYVTACVCRALAYAHAKSRDDKPLGIVHRDISPNNVLISDQGEVKLTDFGIAKAQRKREKTAAGVIKGKVAYMSPEQGIGGVIDKRSDIFSVGSMLYRMLTDKLPFEADNDMDSLLKVQKAEFDPPEKVKPAISPAVSKIIMRAMRLAPSERYQAADEMLTDVERALRTEFHSAGQTELKLWLEQLARRDDVPSIGKRRIEFGGGGVVKDNLGTDLSAGTSFELDDLDPSTSETALSINTGDIIPVRSDPGRPLKTPAKTAQVRPREGSAKFWFGVIAALLAVVGVRYGLQWVKQKQVLGSLGVGGAEVTEPPSTVGPAAPPPSGTPAPTPAPTAEPTPTPTPAPTPGVPPPTPSVAAAHDAAAAPEAAKPAVAAGPGVDAQAAPDAAPEKAVAVVEKPAPKDKGKDEEPDEEALLRDAVPNAESAVIGEDEAEAAPPPKAAAGKGAAAKARPQPVAKPGPGKIDTAILHLTTAPGGAIVRTKARVLGRTPINLHFKSGNIYEIIFIKSGYQTATRRVAVQGTKDRKIAVTLAKKRPPPKRSFFKPHR